MTYLTLFKRIKSERDLNTKQTIELFSKELDRSVRTVSDYSNKGCPSHALEILKTKFKG